MIISYSSIYSFLLDKLLSEVMSFDPQTIFALEKAGVHSLFNLMRTAKHPFCGQLLPKVMQQVIRIAWGCLGGLLTPGVEIK